MALTRRDFLVGVGATAIFCGIGGVVCAAPSNKFLVRPPGGQDEQSFAARCLKCDRCRSACPTNCISISLFEDGLLEMRSPKIDFHKGFCTFCNRCIEVCPTMALRAFDPATEKIGVAVVNERCIAWKNPGACVKCQSACSYQAIDIHEGFPVVNAELCNGCGACEYVCPALVFTSTTDKSDRGIVVVPVKAKQEGREGGK